MLLTSMLVKKKEVLGADMFREGNTRDTMPVNIIHRDEKGRRKDSLQTRRNVGVQPLPGYIHTCADNVREAGASRLICTFET